MRFTFISFVLGSILLAAQSALSQEDTRPDVLLILVDDLGWHDVGFTGGTTHKTPNIDALAAQGTVYQYAYADAPNCAPTRASLLTGLATPRHGILTVGTSKRGKAEHRRLEPVPNQTKLDPSVPTLGGLLKDAGWRTVHLGKFHVGSDPLAFGFTDQVGGTSAGHPKSYFSPYKNSALIDGPEGEYLTDRLTNEAIAFLESDDERPLFLYMSFYSVHTPLQARPDLLEAAKKNNPTARGTAHRYSAMVAAVDEAVGRLIEAFEQRSRPGMIIFTSDNGGSGPVADNGGLRGSKGMLYEGGIRVPLAIRWPNEQINTAAEHPVLLRDLAPTILDVADVEMGDVQMDGDSLVFNDGSPSSALRSLHWHFPVYLEGYPRAAGNWRTTPAAAIRQGQYKLLEFFEDGQLELYDLESDPKEQINIASSNEDVVARLQQEMHRWRTEVNAKLPTLPPPTTIEDESQGDSSTDSLKGTS